LTEIPSVVNCFQKFVSL